MRATKSFLLLVPLWTTCSIPAFGLFLFFQIFIPADCWALSMCLFPGKVALCWNTTRVTAQPARSVPPAFQGAQTNSKWLARGVFQAATWEACSLPGVYHCLFCKWLAWRSDMWCINSLVLIIWWIQLPVPNIYIPLEYFDQILCNINIYSCLFPNSSNKLCLLHCYLLEVM